MPNAECEKCKKTLDDICVNEKYVNRLVEMIQKRIKKFAGVPYTISPGIRHSEIVKKTSWKCISDICDGVLYYKPFAPNPKTVNIDFSILTKK